MSARFRKASTLIAGSPTSPVRFGKYYLLGQIARGGMAEVYRARPIKGPARLLAIKVMRKELASQAKFVDMFHREAQLALLLRNEGIVKTVDSGEHAGCHYIAMEYIAGCDLTKVLKRCQTRNVRIPVPHAVYIAACIARGLDYAHNLRGRSGRPLNLTNRDVSPSNVRVAFDGTVKIFDFGIAQALTKFRSEIGSIKGKLSYMSPEQVRGMPVDQRTDIFSTGIILHELLNRQKLFRGDTEFAVMERVRKAQVAPPSRFNPRVSAKVDSIVMKALARDVSKRYQSAAEMREDLDQVVATYRFKAGEMQDFMRKTFREEYTKEQETAKTALESAPPENEEAFVKGTGVEGGPLEELPDATEVKTNVVDCRGGLKTLVDPTKVRPPTEN
jgi:serine/threonine protein kinase